jgi:hypothetical protein
MSRKLQKNQTTQPYYSGNSASASGGSATITNSTGSSISSSSSNGSSSTGETKETQYPRTPHLPFSPGGTNDDVRLSSVTHFKDQNVVITEKLDGGNCMILNGKFFKFLTLGTTAPAVFAEN